jgi:uncharacterized protein YbjT (DUF2867 family)
VQGQSQGLAAKGAEVVKADLDDVESLKKAFAGAHAVYGVTNFWEHFSGEKEKARPRTSPTPPRPPASSTSSGRRSKTRAT